MVTPSMWGNLPTRGINKWQFCRKIPTLSAMVQGLEALVCQSTGNKEPPLVT